MRRLPLRPLSRINRLPVDSCQFSGPSIVSNLNQFACFTTSGSDHHKLFQQQLEELEKERTSFFGNNQVDSADDRNLIDTANKLHTEVNAASLPDGDEYVPDMEELHAEREALFEFSSSEKQVWARQGSEISSNPTKTRLSPGLMKEIEQARAAAAEDLEGSMSSPAPTEPSAQPTIHHESFSHVSQDGNSVHMVDVGHKQATKRMARAQSRVILPPEVLQAFELQQSELVGPKGPIFATAKLAGILAAK